MATPKKPRQPDWQAVELLPETQKHLHEAVKLVGLLLCGLRLKRITIKRTNRGTVSYEATN